MIRLAVSCSILALLGESQPVGAAPVKGIHSRVTQPVCPRGGIMMLQLTADSPGDHWPATVDVKLASGVTVTGSIAWIDLAPARSDRRWTDDPRGLAIRAVLPDDDSSKLEQFGPTGPYLLARVPADGSGPMTLGRQKLDCIWRDVPSLSTLLFNDDVPLPRDRPMMELTPGPDRPDPVSPFEFWRWTLLAQRMELDPPRPFGGDLERMAAEHYAELWRIGLDRLTNQSPRIAEECRNLLTHTCIDRTPRAGALDAREREAQPFAAWIADPSQISALLSRLLDFKKSDADVLSDAVQWLDQQPPVFLWPDAEAVDHVLLRVATLRAEPIVARFEWAGSNEPSSVVQIEPGVLMQVRIDRPTAPQAAAIGLPAPPEPPVHVLHVDAGGLKFDLTFGARIAFAKPPGVFFRPLSPPITLFEVQMRAQRTMASDYQTLAQIRRLSGRWEIFFECHRPARPADRPATLPRGSDEPPRAFDDLRGIEAVTLLMGPQDSSVDARQIWLTVPENGFQQVVRGVNDGTLQVHKRSYSDRWYCRIVLPDTWVPTLQGQPALVGCIRSHGDSAQIETGPNASTPWNPAPARAAINLEQWDDLPQTP